MHKTSWLPIAFLGLSLVFTGCKTYSTVREKRPSYRAVTPAGQMIVQGLKHSAKDPEAKIGHFIDAASVASAALEKRPADKQSLQDYNFAVSRIFEVLHEARLQPWKKPLVCAGASGSWTFSVTHDGKPEHDPSHFRILPADRFQFKGTLVKDRSIKAGLGAPMVIASEGIDPTKFDPFIQGKNVYYGVTEILWFKGRSCTAQFVDPLTTETVQFGRHTFPVAADFTAPLGLALAELKPRKTELKRMFNPSEFAGSARLARLQPYDPKKIPILCIHGLGDSQATWAPMIESLRSDATIRQNYQIWFYSYPTGYPFPLMASILRQKMNAINSYYPGHKPLVVIGHSMGGNITRTLITDSDLKIWNSFFDTPPSKTPLAAENRRMLESALIFRHRNEISRVIFMSASLGGSEVATGFIGRMGKRLIGGPADINAIGHDLVRLAKPRDDGQVLKSTPNSIDALDPKNRFITTLNEIPPTRSIPYHSIIADRGKGGNKDHTPPVLTDGIVPYWSAHLDGAQSEVIVPSGHWSNRNPVAIEEVKRILKLHLGRK